MPPHVSFAGCPASGGIPVPAGPRPSGRRAVTARRAGQAGRRRAWALAAAVYVCAALGTAGSTGAQTPDGAAGTVPRLAVGGELIATVGPRDPLSFNFTDYDQSALRFFVGSLGASWALLPQLALVGELRLENADRVRLSALYVRVTPKRAWPLDIQAGRIPPVFGAFSRDRYGSGNPLISLPLAYQYVTTLRTDSVPSSADTLLRIRGGGWRVTYDPAAPGMDPYNGNARPYDVGRPLVSTSRWDTGVGASLGRETIAVTAAVTTGSLSRPRVGDDNDGRQIAGRLVWRPHPAWSLGVSAARGEFLARRATAGLPASAGRGPWIQRGLGGDVDLAMGHWRVRGEVIRSAWREPVLGWPELASPLEATSATVEIRRRLLPALDLAARADRIVFSTITGTLYGGQATPWDANVSRVEVGAGYRLSRQLRLKAIYQHNWREAGRRQSKGYPAAQLSYWF
jgi:hypothetical protein